MPSKSRPGAFRLARAPIILSAAHSDAWFEVTTGLPSAFSIASIRSMVRSCVQLMNTLSQPSISLAWRRITASTSAVEILAMSRVS